MITETSIAELVELDKQVDFCEGEGLRQRWLFGPADGWRFKLLCALDLFLAGMCIVLLSKGLA